MASACSGVEGTRNLNRDTFYDDMLAFRLIASVSEIPVDAVERHEARLTLGKRREDIQIVGFDRLNIEKCSDGSPDCVCLDHLSFLHFVQDSDCSLHRVPE